MSLPSFLKARALSISDNIVATILFLGGAVVAGWLTDYLAKYYGLTPSVALILAWVIGLLVFVALSLLLKPKKGATAETATPSIQQTQSGNVIAPHNEFNPNNVFNPTINVNVPVSQTQPPPAREPEQLSTARRLLAKQPVFECIGTRCIRRPLDLTNNTIGDKDYKDAELAHDKVNVIVALAKFYYRPDVGVDPSLRVKANIEFRDEGGEPVIINDLMWRTGDDKYKEFNTGDSHELIIALIPVGSTNKFLSYEHNLETFEGGFTRDGGFTRKYLAPEINEIHGKEFNLSVGLIGKRHNEVIMHQSFGLKLTLEPTPELKEIKSPNQLTAVATPSESQSKLDILYEPAHPYEYRDRSSTIRQIRVGIKNNDPKEIPRVKVQIDEIRIAGHVYKSLPLCLARLSRDLEFPLAPEETELVRIALSFEEDRAVILDHGSRDNINDQLSMGTYKFTISAMGTDTKPCRKQAVLDVDAEGHVIFRLVSD